MENIMNFKEAQRIADQGDTKMMCYVGDCYSKGEGVKKNETEGFKWYNRAAKLGNPEAICSVGECENGF